jgi:hypothetical protein
MEDNWKKYIVKHNDKIIKDVLGDMMGKNKRLNRGYAYIRIQNAWKIEMGDMINSYTNKMYFSGGILTVYLTSAPLRSELSMSKPKVIEILNAACQERLIKEVIFR